MTTDDQLNIQRAREREKLISWAYKNTHDILERERARGCLWLWQVEGFTPDLMRLRQGGHDWREM